MLDDLIILGAPTPDPIIKEKQSSHQSQVREGGNESGPISEKTKHASQVDPKYHPQETKK